MSNIMGTIMFIGLVLAFPQALMAILGIFVVLDALVKELIRIL